MNVCAEYISLSTSLSPPPPSYLDIPSCLPLLVQCAYMVGNVSWRQQQRYAEEEGEENPLLSLFFLFRIKPKSRNTRRRRSFPFYTSPNSDKDTRSHTKDFFFKKTRKGIL